MDIEEEIYNAGNVLQGASGIIETGLSLWNDIRQTFNPVPFVGPDPAGEVGGQEEIGGAKPAVSKPPNAGILIVVGIVLYLLMR